MLPMALFVRFPDVATTCNAMDNLPLLLSMFDVQYISREAGCIITAKNRNPELVHIPQNGTLRFQ
jgi:hypothetical protein